MYGIEEFIATESNVRLCKITFDQRSNTLLRCTFFPLFILYN